MMLTPLRTDAVRVLVCVLLAALILGCSPGERGQYHPGGRNIEAQYYAHTDGNPACPDRAAFLGTIRGDWYEIGRSIGARAAESTRVVSDLWWREVCENFGHDETLKALPLYEAQIAALDPGLVELLHGIAAGAGPSLAESPYADEDHPLHGTDYQRVLAVNVYDEWAMMHPRRFPDGTSTFGGSIDGPFEIPHMAGCSVFAARGPTTSRGEVIVAHNRHSPYDPRCYQQVLVLQPTGGSACWILSNSPQVSGNHVVNEHGVSITLNAGGMTNPRSLAYDGGPYFAEAFGVPWFHLFLWVGTHARTAEEAIEMLTRGTEAYRDRTGRHSLLRAGGWIFLVADGSTLAVVEATAERYAVRYAGDEQLFTGADWTDEGYIVATNHYVSDFSYGAANERSGVPMTVFNEGYWRDPETGEIDRLTESGTRFWTLMWDLRDNAGAVDSYRAQQILSGLYARDPETGERIDVAQKDDGTWDIYGRFNSCTAGVASFGAGTCDGKIAVLDGAGVSVSWTTGNPIHWQGAWDRFEFD